MKRAIILAIISTLCAPLTWAEPTTFPTTKGARGVGGSEGKKAVRGKAQTKAPETRPSAGRRVRPKASDNTAAPNYPIFVVERGRGKIAVIRGGKLAAELKGLGLLHHATLKFRWGRGYLISRDGLLSELDIRGGKILRQVRVGESSIGLTFTDDKIAVANYRPGEVVVLDRNLRIIQRIGANSRCVGIKSWGKYLLFSLMDRDEIWLLKEREDGKFYKIAQFREEGGMPYDAMLAPPYYLNALFKKRQFFGVVDIRRAEYRRLPVKKLFGGGITYKIPHFGMWGRWKDRAYLPITGSRGLAVVELSTLKWLQSIELSGLPVFVAVSPGGKYIAVNYSGQRQNYLTIIRRRDLRILREAPVGRRIMHFRFTPDGQYIAVSSYFEHRVKLLTLPDLKEKFSIVVPTPSGIFIPYRARK